LLVRAASSGPEECPHGLDFALQRAAPELSEWNYGAMADIDVRDRSTLSPDTRKSWWMNVRVPLSLPGATVRRLPAPHPSSA
jgi:hypothetical protein